jgi:hypothetical protein
VEKVGIEPNAIVVKEATRRKEKYAMLTQAQIQRLAIFTD